MTSLGVGSTKFETHSLGWTNPALIYRRSGNLRAVQLLLGHYKSAPFSTSGVDEPIEIAQRLECYSKLSTADVVGIGVLLADHGAEEFRYWDLADAQRCLLCRGSSRRAEPGIRRSRRLDCVRCRSEICIALMPAMAQVKTCRAGIEIEAASEENTMITMSA